MHGISSHLGTSLQYTVCVPVLPDGLKQFPVVASQHNCHNSSRLPANLSIYHLSKTQHHTGVACNICKRDAVISLDVMQGGLMQAAPLQSPPSTGLRHYSTASKQCSDGWNDSDGRVLEWAKSCSQGMHGGACCSRESALRMTAHMSSHLPTSLKAVHFCVLHSNLAQAKVHVAQQRAISHILHQA